MLGRRAGDAAREVALDANLVISVPQVIELVRRSDRRDDPVVRQRLATLVSYARAGQWNAQRGRAEAAQGRTTSVASIGKIAQTRIVKLAAELALDVLGADGLLAGADAPDHGMSAQAFVFSPASSIYGGADEIQRNIAGERTLGLPREPAPDRGRPFREVLHGS